MTPQHRTSQRSGASTFLSPIQFVHIFYIPLQNNPKSQKNFICCANPKKKPHSKPLHMTIKRPPRARRPLMTDRAERLTLVRGSRPTLPTASAALFLLPPTGSRTFCGKSVCYGWFALHCQLHTIIVGQIGAPPQPAGT